MRPPSTRWVGAGGKNRRTGFFQEDRRRARTAGGREQEVWIFQEDRRRDAVGPCQFTHCVITCSPARSYSPVPRPPAPRPGSCSPAKSRSPVPRPPHRNSGGVFNMMSGWTGRVYQTAWTLDFASERSDAKSHVRNRQDGPDIMHLRRTRNVRFSNIVEQSPFLSWTDGLAIKTPNRSPEFDTRTETGFSMRAWRTAQSRPDPA